MDTREGSEHARDLEWCKVYHLLLCEWWYTKKTVYNVHTSSVNNPDLNSWSQTDRHRVFTLALADLLTHTVYKSSMVDYAILWWCCTVCPLILSHDHMLITPGHRTTLLPLAMTHQFSLHIVVTSISDQGIDYYSHLWNIAKNSIPKIATLHKFHYT